MNTKIQLIDTHAHIYDSELKGNFSEMRANWKSENVEYVLMPNIDSDSIPSMHHISKDCEECLPMMGLHPCYVKDDYLNQLWVVENNLKVNSYSAVGEIGIDLYWDKTYAEEQEIAFLKQIDWALEYDLPIVIHSRDSLDLTIDLVTSKQNGKLKGVFHCFNGSVEQAKQIMDIGFYMGIGGVLTYKNSGLGDTVAQLPLTHLVLETDSPYLSPAPYRGKKNQPAYLRYICQKVAEVKSMSYDNIALETTKNAKKLFGLPPKVAEK